MDQKDHDNLIRFETKLDAILAQTIKTNGRITCAEEKIITLQNWKNYIAGGIALFCVIGLPALWILVNDVRVSGDLIKSHIGQSK